MPKKPVKTKENTDNPEDSLDLQSSADELVDGGLPFYESEDLPEALREQFMDYITAFEEAEWVTAFDVLVQGGLELPHPDELDNSQLAAKLWEVVRGLAMLRMFLYNTDHLSDRELYEELWHELLREEGPLLPFNSDTACHIDLVGSGSERDIELYLRYYADEVSRRDWAKDWPDDVMPMHEAPPFDRDRHLPASDQAEWRNVGKPS
ncbi:MAG: hypothetical protein EPN89_07230 [Methylovulum sp.]|nr:MAG: hypothetical protein EPN89_07230 [Methylovulum sp.]